MGREASCREQNLADRVRIRDRVIEALVGQGYPREGMKLDASFSWHAGEEGELRVPVDVLVFVEDRPALLVKCVRGNLSTRERPSVALARLLSEPPIPLAVVANERDAVVYDGISGRPVGRGYRAFPSPEEARRRLSESARVFVPADQKEREKRILHTYYHLRCAAEAEPF